MQQQLETEKASPALSWPAGKKPHIIVVGGGAGGLELATKLGNKYGRWKSADVTLIDRARTLTGSVK
jgi:NADH:ubiquinone reductase (H+-translocating)